ISKTTATPETSTLSLHDALPIWWDEQPRLALAHDVFQSSDRCGDHRPRALHGLERDHAEAFAERRHNHGERLLDSGLDRRHVTRSEEHTSELQSRGHLVCRLLLE